MTPKERAAMQQALDALCNAVKPKHGFYYSLTEVPIDCAYKYQNAITALREALSGDNVSPIEQAEQEPDYFGLTHDHTWLSIEKKQYDKLKPEGRMACYAAPVRTKDLTDAFINELHKDAQDPISFARAVIAADREKNK